MKRQLKKIIPAVLILTFIAGCSTQKEIKNEDNFIDIDDNKPLIYLFDKLNQRVVKYNTEKFKIEEKLYDDINMFQYELLYRDDKVNSYNNRLLTSGHNINNNFKIIRLTDKKIETLLELERKDEEELIPVDVYNDKIFFISVLYEEKKWPYQYDIVSYDKDLKNRQKIVTSKDYIENVVCLEDKIYYIESPSINSDRRNLYCVNLNEKEANPEKCETDIDIVDIFRYQDKLITCDKNNMYGVYDFNIVYDMDSYFDDKTQILIQFLSRDGKNKFVMTDLKNNKELISFDNPIDFQYVDDDNLEIYCDGAINKIKISELRNKLGK